MLLVRRQFCVNERASVLFNPHVEINLAQKDCKQFLGPITSVIYLHLVTSLMSLWARIILAPRLRIPPHNLLAFFFSPVSFMTSGAHKLKQYN